MSLLKKLASQTAIYGLSSILGRLLNWLLTPLYLNMFPKSEFGMLSDLYGMSFYFAVLLTFGLETSFFKFAEDKESASKAYNTGFITIFAFSFSFLIIFGLNYHYFAYLLGYGQRPILFLILCGIIFFDCIAALPLAHLRYENKIKKLEGLIK